MNIRITISQTSFQKLLILKPNSHIKMFKLVENPHLGIPVGPKDQPQPMHNLTKVYLMRE